MVRKVHSETRTGKRTKADAEMKAPDTEDKEGAPKRKMKMTDYRRLRETLRMQKASYSKSLINPTQFRRLVAEVMRELAPAGLRISKRALAPLLLVVENDIHRVLTGARYISYHVGKQKSVTLASVNLAEAFLLRPETMAACPALRLSSFTNEFKGIEVEVPVSGEKATESKKPAKKEKKEKKAKKEKKEKKVADVPPAEAVVEAAKADEEEMEEEEEDEEEEA